MNILPSIKQILVAGGITTQIKYNGLTDGKQMQIAIRDTGEIEPDINDTTSIDIEMRTFQVLVRGTDYDELSQLNNLIRRALHERIGVKTTAHHFYMIGTLSGLQPITNEVGNYEFSGNFKAKVRAL